MEKGTTRSWESRAREATLEDDGVGAPDLSGAGHEEDDGDQDHHQVLALLALILEAGEEEVRGLVPVPVPGRR